MNIEASLGFPGLLTLLFVALKLTHYIDWSWIWVLSPLWLPFLLMLLGVVVVGVLNGVGYFVRGFF